MISQNINVIKDIFNISDSESDKWSNTNSTATSINDGFSSQQILLLEPEFEEKGIHNCPQLFRQQFPTYDDFKKLVTQPISVNEIVRMANLEQHDAQTNEATEEWLTARKILNVVQRISGSTFGGIVGMNKYCSSQKSLMNYLWPSFTGNQMTAYGNHHEDDCEAAFDLYNQQRVKNKEIDCNNFVLVDFKISHFGIILDALKPHLGYSPDGMLTEFWRHNNGRTKVVYKLTEYKCPWSRRKFKLQDLTKKIDDLYPQNCIKHTNLVLPVPESYYCQMQLGMTMFQQYLTRSEAINTKHTTIEKDTIDCDAVDCDTTYCAECMFVVWAPPETTTSAIKIFPNRQKNAIFVSSKLGTIEITKVSYNKEFASKMLKTATQWWSHEYLPLAYEKGCGLLQTNEISTTKNIIDILL
tara:strand:+ start:81 stop:1316 length:1236 start_codon:yes stop_codon:yes gene_type:complete